MMNMQILKDEELDNVVGGLLVGRFRGLQTLVNVVQAAVAPTPVVIFGLSWLYRPSVAISAPPPPPGGGGGPPSS